MCVCGCAQYLKQGKEVALKRAVEIVNRLGVTPENSPLFEDGETICGLLGPKLSLSSAEAAEVWDIVKTVNSFHEERNKEKYRAALDAARDVFNHFPVKGNPKEILILWQQLESLHHVLSDEMMDSLKEPSLRATLRAMRHVHEGREKRKEELVRKCKLEGE